MIKIKTLLKFILKILIITILLFLIIVGILIYNGYNEYNEVVFKLPIETRINNLKEETKNYTYLNDVPDYLKDATVSIEDHRFYDHSGVDILAITRAIITNFREKALSEGGSTITQQLAQNLYFEKDKKISRKIAEVFVTADLEENYSKDEILEYYLNIIYYGDGNYGIGNASLGYFDKTPDKLTIYEQTLLAGLPNAPSIYALSNDSPYTYQRHNQVVNSMLENNKITEDEANEIFETNKDKIEN